MLADRPAAGKTGTTDNYGDAWFVGYTPQLAVAVWVGYPDRLQPMLTEFGGKPVAGGTLPAQIWRAFMTAADKQLKEAPEQFPPTPYIPAQEKRIVWRGGSYKLDNGYCPGTRLVAYFAGQGPSMQAKCYANEVSVPLVVGKTIDTANEMLAQQPLGSELIGVPDQAGQAPGLRRQAGATQRLPVRERHGAALRDATGPALWPAAESRRVERHRRAVAAQDAEGPHDDHLRQGSGRVGPGADSRARGRRRQGAQGDAGRGPRDTQRESLIT